MKTSMKTSNVIPIWSTLTCMSLLIYLGIKLQNYKLQINENINENINGRFVDKIMDIVMDIIMDNCLNYVDIKHLQCQNIYISE